MNKDKLNTQKGYINSYIVFLRASGKDAEADKLAVKRDGLSKQIIKNQKNQVLSPSREENQVSFKTIRNKQKELETLFRGNVQDNTMNIQCLLVSLYSVVPPLRTEPLDMRIYSEFQPDITEENYIFRRKNIYYYQINKDKVSNQIGVATIKTNKKISTLIDLSLIHFPRDYLLTAPLGNGKTPLSYTRFREIMNYLFGGKNVYIDVLRSAYLTQYVKGRSITEIEKIGKKMRTSYETIIMNYVKIPRNKKRRERYAKKKEEKKATDDLVKSVLDADTVEGKMNLVNGVPP
jgi:hypothetical protein